MKKVEQEADKKIKATIKQSEKKMAATKRAADKKLKDAESKIA
jgi:hypothetical protein